MQDAGAARNQRTSNGPSGTPAPTECMTGATAEQPRAVGDAGPYGGIDESTPVLGGAPMRAVGDAGPYAVRHCRAEHGSGSGSCRRVPEPVIARHPRGAWERQRLLSPSTGACHSTPPVRCVGAAAIRERQAIRCTTISIYFGFRGVHGGVL